MGGQDEDYRRRIETERRAKDQFFATSPHSPLPPANRHHFQGLAYFLPDRQYRFEGLRLQPYEGSEPATFAIPTSDGQLRPAQRLGQLRFDLEGTPVALTAYGFEQGHAGSLFVPFLDATSGRETYGSGRYLDIDPESDGTYVLDFNRAYNPYCVYSPYYSCPLTPEENRLPVRVEAGERLPEAHGGEEGA